MGTEPAASGTWRYCVHDGKVYCPLRSTYVDVAGCTACIYLESDPASGYVACLPPPGRDLAGMLEAVARY